MSSLIASLFRYSSKLSIPNIPVLDRLLLSFIVSLTSFEYSLDKLVICSLISVKSNPNSVLNFSISSGFTAILLVKFSNAFILLLYL